MGLWTLPHTQTIFHHLPDADMGAWQTYAWFIGWATLLGSGWYSSRHSALLRFALVGGILVLLPSSSFAALQENMAEHRSHQFGFFFGLYLLTAMWKFHDRYLWKGVVSVLILGLCSQTYLRNQIWTSEVRLWQEATLVNPDSAKAWYGLGDAHRFAKQFEPSLAAFATCTRIDPMEMDCWNNWGIVYAEMSNMEKARETWMAALDHNSAYCKAHSNLGFLSYRQENWDDALVEFRSALVYCPTNVIAHYGLGLLYYGPRLDVQKAIHHFDKVLTINPNFDYASDARQKLLDLTW
jgi:tetratricopeptide (TPR) repeat protein